MTSCCVSGTWLHCYLSYLLQWHLAACLVLDYIVTCHTHYNDVLLCVWYLITLLLVILTTMTSCCVSSTWLHCYLSYSLQWRLAVCLVLDYTVTCNTHYNDVLLCVSSTWLHCYLSYSLQWRLAVCLVLDYTVTCHTHYNDVLLCVSSTWLHCYLSYSLQWRLAVCV